MEDYGLRQRQSLPLEQKIVLAERRIEEWYDHWDGDVYVSFSGGKDSTVLLDLVRRRYPDVPAVFSHTGLEYPEIVEFVKAIDNVVTIRPKIPFNQVIQKYGFPVVSKEQSQYIYQLHHAKSQKTIDTRLNGNKWGMGKISEKWKYLIDAPFPISDKCCTVLKKDPFKRYEKESGRKPYLGIMATESAQRAVNWVKYGCNAFDATRPVSKPLSVWTEQDVLQYIKKYELPYASIYGDIVEGDDGRLRLTGAQRTGCMFCLYGIQKEEHPNRIVKMKETHPKQYDYCVNKLGIGQVLDFMGIPKE